MRTKIMSRHLTKTATLKSRLCLEHPKVPNKPRLLSRGTRKDFLILFFLAGLILFGGGVAAVCPVCTVAVGIGVGILRAYGVDDIITGLWIGSLIVSSVAWFLSWLSKKNIRFPFKKIIVTIGFYALFVLPLYYLKIIGNPANIILGIDKLLMGIIFGSVLFILAMLSDSYLRKINENKVVVNYQKVFIPMIFLIIASVVAHLLLGIYGA